jgi:hypothetical protein
MIDLRSFLLPRLRRDGLDGGQHIGPPTEAFVEIAGSGRLETSANDALPRAVPIQEVGTGTRPRWRCSRHVPTSARSRACMRVPLPPLLALEEPQAHRATGSDGFYDRWLANLERPKRDLPADTTLFMGHGQLSPDSTFSSGRRTTSRASWTCFGPRLSAMVCKAMRLRMR